MDYVHSETVPFARLSEQPGDALLSLIALHANDTRPDKLDLGVGVYRDEAGHTPIMSSVKAAERRLIEEQETKSYLGAEGDARFVALLTELAFGSRLARERPVWGLQTPGGTGALRLGAALLARANASATIWLGTPGWPNHPAIFGDAGLAVRTWTYYDVARAQVDFSGMLEALDQAPPGDIVLLHGCCHNPTGASLSIAQWQELATFMAERRLIPFLDLAYQGLGEGLEEDAAGLRIMAQASPTMVVAYSCSKNFGLYRDRVGALWVLDDARRLDVVRGNVLALARSLWSMPPAHGAAVVRLILDTPSLAAEWRAELASMRSRLSSLRSALATAHPSLEFLAGQQGLFSMLPISPQAVRELREANGIFMPESGRINLAGLRSEDVERFAGLIIPHFNAAETAIA